MDCKLIPVCAWCHNVKSSVSEVIALGNTQVKITHTICSKCSVRMDEVFRKGYVEGVKTQLNHPQEAGRLGLE